MTHSFYIHIPFCNQKCPYCKFALTPVFDEIKKKRYIEYLKKEIREYFRVSLSVCKFGESVSEDFRENKAMDSGGLGREIVGVSGETESSGAKPPYPKGISNATKSQMGSFSLSNAFDTFGNKSIMNSVGKNQEDSEINPEGQKYTIYFGGGTPSILSHDEIRSILECFPFYKNIETEITLESNPEDINQEYVVRLINLGINRLSMGVQTLNDASLKEIHRSSQDTIFTALTGVQSVMSITPISVNIDFILGLPYTRSGEILEGIKKLHKKYPCITHTSVYMLEDENYPKYWRENSITESEMQREFLDIMAYFQSIGWHHYELSNFAKPGYESIHNQRYWDHSNTRGFGLSAASYEDNRRWSNESSFGGYYQGQKTGEEILTDEEISIENMMFGLRTSGWKIDNNIKQKYENNINSLTQDKLIQCENNTITLTKTGIFLIDHIMCELIK